MSIAARLEVNALRRSAMYLSRFGLTRVCREPFTELTLFLH